MYYLLEENPTRIRILDDKNNEIEHRQITDIKEEMKISFQSSIKVIKFSESVFDLINWNEDLVNIGTSCGSLMVDCKHAKSDFSDGFYDVEWITAIYKPNSNGDYIKVWEKKEYGDGFNGKDN